MEKSYFVTEEALATAVLESAYRFAYGLCHTLLESSVDEFDLSSIRDAYQQSVDDWRYNPDRFVSNIFGSLHGDAKAALNAVRRVLANHGITTGTDPDGYPIIQRTSKFNANNDRNEIRRRILAAAPQLKNGFEPGKNGKCLFSPADDNGSGAYACKSIGDVTSLLKSLDGKGLSVQETGSQKYGWGDDALVETEFVITLPKQRQSA